MPAPLQSNSTRRQAERLRCPLAGNYRSSASATDAMNPHAIRRQAAFTLIEMLVVLLIVGMTTTLLFQMLSQTFRMQRYAGIQIADSRQGAMEADWFRQVINGLQ